MGECIISRISPDGGARVGDVRLTTRNTLGDKWALCNGDYRPDVIEYDLTDPKNWHVLNFGQEEALDIGDPAIRTGFVFDKVQDIYYAGNETWYLAYTTKYDVDAQYNADYNYYGVSICKIWFDTEGEHRSLYFSKDLDTIATGYFGTNSGLGPYDLGDLVFNQVVTSSFYIRIISNPESDIKLCTVVTLTESLGSGSRFARDILYIYNINTQQHNYYTYLADVSKLSACTKDDNVSKLLDIEGVSCGICILWYQITDTSTDAASFSAQKGQIILDVVEDDILSNGRIFTKSLGDYFTNDGKYYGTATHGTVIKGYLTSAGGNIVYATISTSLFNSFHADISHFIDSKVYIVDAYGWDYIELGTDTGYLVDDQDYELPKIAMFNRPAYFGGNINSLVVPILNTAMYKAIPLKLFEDYLVEYDPNLANISLNDHYKTPFVFGNDIHSITGFTGDACPLQDGNTNTPMVMINISDKYYIYTTVIGGYNVIYGPLPDGYNLDDATNGLNNKLWWHTNLYTGVSIYDSNHNLSNGIVRNNIAGNTLIALGCISDMITEGDIVMVAPSVPTISIDNAYAFIKIKE